MLNPTLLLGLLLTSGEIPQIDKVCWIDPMTGRPYLAKCEKARKSTRAPVAEKPEKPRESREPATKTDE